MRDDQGNIVHFEVCALDRLGSRLRHRGNGEAKDLVPVHFYEVQTFINSLVRSRIAASASWHLQEASPRSICT
jgi:hypothetical protein